MNRNHRLRVGDLFIDETGVHMPGMDVGPDGVYMNGMVVNNQGVFLNGRRVDNPERYGVLINDPMQNTYGDGGYNMPHNVSQQDQARQPNVPTSPRMPQNRMQNMKARLNDDGSITFPNWEALMPRRVDYLKMNDPVMQEQYKLVAYHANGLITDAERDYLQEAWFYVVGEASRRGAESVSFNVKHAFYRSGSSTSSLDGVMSQTISEEQGNGAKEELARDLAAIAAENGVSVADVAKVMGYLANVSSDTPFSTSDLKGPMRDIMPYIRRYGAEKLCAIAQELKSHSGDSERAKDIVKSTIRFIEDARGDSLETRLVNLRNYTQRTPFSHGMGSLVKETRNVSRPGFDLDKYIQKEHDWFDSMNSESPGTYPTQPVHQNNPFGVLGDFARAIGSIGDAVSSALGGGGGGDGGDSTLHQEAASQPSQEDQHGSFGISGALDDNGTWHSDGSVSWWDSLNGENHYVGHADTRAEAEDIAQSSHDSYRGD